MGYNGSDNVSDIMRSLDGDVVQGCPVATDTPVVDKYYAVSLFEGAGHSPNGVQVLLRNVCRACMWYPLFLRGHCACQMDYYCNGNAETSE